MLKRSHTRKTGRGPWSRARSVAYSLLAALVASTLCWPVGTIALADAGSSSKPFVEDIGIAKEGSSDMLAYASAPGESDMVSITDKGGTVSFVSELYWNVGAPTSGSDYVQWESSDPAVASVDVRGTVTAKSDGTATITARISGDYTEDGQPMEASLPLVVTGQAGAPYVEAITVVGPDGNQFPDNSFSIEGEGQLSTYTLSLGAVVTVVDPQTGAAQDYLVTAANPLSSQVAGIGDLIWSVGDANMGAIDEATGLYKPKKYGSTLVMASSTAGLGNARVTGSAFITAVNPDSDQEEDGYHPQNSLTVKIFYASKPETVVSEKTYDVSDLEALGTMTETYTALGSRGWYCFTAEGVPLETILNDCGLQNMGDVQTMSFETFDSINTGISGSYLFDTRYYYPNIDMTGGPQFSEAKRVVPMIALRSCEVLNGSTSPNYDAMSEGTRFRLLFGSTPAGGTTSSLIKWISGLNIAISGSPDGDQPQPDPAPGDGDNAAPAGGTGSGTGAGSGYGNGDGSGTGDAGTGSGGGLRGGNVGGDAPQGDNGDSSAAEGAAGGFGDEQAGSSAQRSVFQIDRKANTFDQSDEPTDSQVFFWRVVAPLGAAVLAAGPVQMVAWYRRQTQPVALSRA